MKDLISREALLQQIGEKLNVLRGCNDFKEAWGMRYAMVMIQNAPAVDAVEVVHGRWERLNYVNGWARCSRCESTWELEKIDAFNMTFCPNCGARMDGESNE